MAASRAGTALCIALGAAVSGCASFSSDRGLTAVSGIVRPALGADVAKASIDNRAATESRVQRLLKSTLSADAAVRVALLNNKGLQAERSGAESRSEGRQVRHGDAMDSEHGHARSVTVSAGAVDDPPALGAQNIEEGFEHYDEMCTTCHGGPGIERSEIGKGLNPRAPDLGKAIKAWAPRQLFWIVKHGVKLAGMPSFGVTHNDEQIWSIVAFVEKLPEMSPEQCRQMRQQPSHPRSHGDPMDMKH